MTSPEPSLPVGGTDGGTEDQPYERTDSLPEPSSRSGLGFAAFMIIAGIMHFVAPSFYEGIVPKWAGDPRRVVWWSGWAEIACGTLVAIPKSRRAGAWAALVVLVAVYPANIKMALDAGRPHDALSWGAWLRLPLQLPMWWWAIRTAKRAEAPTLSPPHRG